MHRVFVSFYHRDDQHYKDDLVEWAKDNKVFIDGSVATWNKLTPDNLRMMLDNAYDNRLTQPYDLSREMRRKNGNISIMPYDS